MTTQVRTEPITVNLGPQHPSTHGVFRMRVTFDGEEIIDVEPIFGYLHRGSEKLAEERTYVQVVTLDRPHGLCRVDAKQPGVHAWLSRSWLVSSLRRGVCGCG